MWSNVLKSDGKPGDSRTRTALTEHQIQEVRNTAERESGEKWQKR